MKLCVDCKHHEKRPEGLYAHYCLRSARRTVSVITGETIETGEWTCHHERETDAEHRCGPEGKFWEAKP